MSAGLEGTAQAQGRPFLKWAGGKTQLLGQYAELLPSLSDLATYHEPFLGSGAVFFHARARAIIPGRAVLSDVNEHLMTTWRVVRDQPEALAQRAAELGARHSEEQYYVERERFNDEQLEPLERAALVIYLNKAGFNGVYRVNRSGGFNVPVGRRTGGSGLGIPSAEHLAGCARSLAGSDLLTAPFTTVLDRARPGDFVYFDPPYMPISDTASFTDYACEGFGRPEQEMLRDVAVQLSERGVLVMISNSGNFELLRLYDGFDVARVSARRNINSRGDARGPVTEVVVRNYR